MRNEKGIALKEPRIEPLLVREDAVVHFTFFDKHRRHGLRLRITIRDARGGVVAKSIMPEDMGRTSLPIYGVRAFEADGKPCLFSAFIELLEGEQVLDSMERGFDFCTVPEKADPSVEE